MQGRPNTVAAHIQHKHGDVFFIDLKNVECIPGQFLTGLIPPAKSKAVRLGKRFRQLGLLDFGSGLEVTFELLIDFTQRVFGLASSGHIRLDPDEMGGDTLLIPHRRNR